MKNQKFTIKKSIVAKFENKSNSSNQKSSVGTFISLSQN